MRRALAILMLVCLAFALVPLVPAVANAEVWEQQDDGWTDGMMQFGEIAMALLWVFGFWTKIRW